MNLQRFIFEGLQIITFFRCSFIFLWFSTYFVEITKNHLHFKFYLKKNRCAKFDY